MNRLMPTYKKTNGDYDEFKKVANASDLLDGIEDSPTLDDDEAYDLAQSLWLEAMKTTSNKEEAILSFIDYLEFYKDQSKGICISSSN